MKKTLIFAVGLILLITGSSWASAIVQITDYISFPVVALDSVTGVECVPESVHVHVWRGSLTNTTVYSNREVCDGADCAQIDSVATGYAGAVPQQYYFHDRVQDIDGSGAPGVYTINVRLWRGTTPTSNWYSFQIVGLSFSDAILAVTYLLDDSLGALKNAGLVSLDDSLGNAKHEAILTNAVADSIAIAINDANKVNFAANPLLDDSLGFLKNQVTMAFDDDTTWATNPKLTLERVFVRPEAGNTDAIYAWGLGTGAGALFEGGTGSGSKGLHGYSSAVSGYGVYFEGTGSASVGQFVKGVSYGSQFEGTLYDINLSGTHHMGGWMDSVLHIDNVSTQITSIQAYLGAGDSWRQHLLPFGEANKDSIRTFNAGTCNSTIYIWKDASDVSIPDSLLQEIW